MLTRLLIRPAISAKSELAVLCLATVAIVLILRTGIALPAQLSLLELPGNNTLSTAGSEFFGGLGGPILFSLFVCAALWLPEKIREVTVIGTVLCGFALALSELWGSGASNGPVVGGFLPNSDARGYVYEASRLTEGMNFTPWGSRRPLAGSYMAAMLWLGNNNLRTAVALMVAFAGLSVALLLAEIRRQQGVVAAAIAAFVIFTFYRRYLGSPLSESCGITFGAIGLTLLLRGFARQHMFLIGAGIVCVTNGLNARAGAFFLLPCLLLACFWRWREDWRRAVKVAVIAGLCMAASAAANVAIYKSIGAKEGKMFSNLGLTLYGVIHGGTWTTAYENHPELLKIPEGEQAMVVYRMVWQDLKNEPSLAWRGAGRSWVEFFASRNGPFVYVHQFQVENALLYAAALGIVFAAVSVRSRPDSALVLSGLVGVALSLPFAPPWDADSMRAYAVTIPFFAMTSGFGATALGAFSRRIRQCRDHTATVPAPAESIPLPIAVPIAGILLFCLLAMPLIIRFWLRPQLPSLLRRTADQAELTITLRPGNVLEVIPENASRTYLPQVRQSDFLERLGYYGKMWHEQADYLRQLAPLDPTFVIPGSTGLGFVVLRHRTVTVAERVTFQGKVHAVVDGDFFVEDGLPSPRSTK